MLSCYAYWIGVILRSRVTLNGVYIWWMYSWKRYVSGGRFQSNGETKWKVVLVGNAGIP